MKKNNIIYPLANNNKNIINNNNPKINPKELLILEKKKPSQAENIWHKLNFTDRLQLILKTEGEERERLIILAKDSIELTQALPPNEFVATIMQLDFESAEELLALSSNEQLTYLLDITGWLNDNFCPERYEIWLPLLLNAGSIHIKRWLTTTDLEVLALLFSYWFKVIKHLPSDDDNQETINNLPNFTLDGIYYIEFNKNTNINFVIQILILLNSEISERYYKILETIFWESTLELNETATYWRLKRLQDYGFPERSEAINLWAKPTFNENNWKKLPPKITSPLSYYPLNYSKTFFNLLPTEYTLPVLIKTLDIQSLENLYAELAYIINCIIVALNIDPFSPLAITKASQEGLGLVNLGLELLTKNHPNQKYSLIQRMPLAAVVRQANQAIKKLSKRASYLITQGWLKNIQTGIQLLDSPLNYWISGLLLPRPQCYNYKNINEKIYMPFLKLADLIQAEYYLFQAEFWGILLKLLGITKKNLIIFLKQPSWPKNHEDIKIHTILATWLAQQKLNLKGNITPIPYHQLYSAIKILQNSFKGPLYKEINNFCQNINEPRLANLAKQMLYSTIIKIEEVLSPLNINNELDPRFLSGLVIER